MAAQRMVKCELCEKNKDGTWFCKNCHQSICVKCKKIHQRANVSKHHDIISRAHMFETQGDNARPVDEYCKEHTKEIYILFCNKCKVLVCRKCITRGHRNHDFIEIENVFKEKRRKAENLVREISRDEDHNNSTAFDYDDLKEKIKDKALKIKNDVDTAKDEMLSQLNKLIASLRENQSENEEQALTMLNRGLQSNKSSELLAAVEFSQSFQRHTDAKGGGSSNIKYSCGLHTLDDVRHLLGTLNVILPAYTISHMEMDIHSMCLSYQHRENQAHEEEEAQLMGTKPFSEDFERFSIEIKSEGKKGEIAIGIAPKGLQSDRFPGWDHFSYGYHADDGGIYTGDMVGADLLEPRRCFAGDKMECRFQVGKGLLEFLKNGIKVYGSHVELLHEAYFPVIAMSSPGESVCLLEEAPWFVSE